MKDRASWLPGFVLKWKFQSAIADELAPLRFALIRRAEAAVDEWELAVAATPSSPESVSAYFTALRHFEACVAALWQGLEFLRKSSVFKKAVADDAATQERFAKGLLFVKGDGSIYERLAALYNVSRHFDPEELPEGDLHRVWITNEALKTRESEVRFDELRDLLELFVRFVVT